jgi:hypothetical protein
VKQGSVYTEFFFIHGADNTGLLLIENLVYTDGFGLHKFQCKFNYFSKKN